MQTPSKPPYLQTSFQSQPGTPGGLGRLDRLLDLVTEHEARYREQDLRLGDLSRRVGDVSAQIDGILPTVSVVRPIEEGVRAELDAARSAMEKLHQQLQFLGTEHETLREQLVATREAREAADRRAAEQEAKVEGLSRLLTEAVASIAALRDEADRGRRDGRDAEGKAKAEAEGRARELEASVQGLKAELAATRAALVTEAAASRTATEACGSRVSEAESLAREVRGEALAARRAAEVVAGTLEAVKVDLVESIKETRRTAKKLVQSVSVSSADAARAALEAALEPVLSRAAEHRDNTLRTLREIEAQCKKDVADLASQLSSSVASSTGREGQALAAVESRLQASASAIASLREEQERASRRVARVAQSCQEVVRDVVRLKEEAREAASRSQAEAAMAGVAEIKGLMLRLGRAVRVLGAERERVSDGLSASLDHLMATSKSINDQRQELASLAASLGAVVEAVKQQRQQQQSPYAALASSPALSYLAGPGGLGPPPPGIEPFHQFDAFLSSLKRRLHEAELEGTERLARLKSKVEAAVRGAGPSSRPRAASLEDELFDELEAQLDRTAR